MNAANTVAEMGRGPSLTSFDTHVDVEAHTVNTYKFNYKAADSLTTGSDHCPSFCNYNVDITIYLTTSVFCYYEHK